MHVQIFIFLQLLSSLEIVYFYILHNLQWASFLCDFLNLMCQKGSKKGHTWTPSCLPVFTQYATLIWMFFCILVQIAVSPSDLGGIPLGDNNEYSWGLTWGRQGESVQAACLYRGRQQAAGRPNALCDMLLPSQPGLHSLLHAYRHLLCGLPHLIYSCTPFHSNGLYTSTFKMADFHGKISSLQWNHLNQCIHMPGRSKSEWIREWVQLWWTLTRTYALLIYASRPDNDLGGNIKPEAIIAY